MNALPSHVPTPPTPRPPRARSGFTLVEMLIGSGLAAVLLTAFLLGFMQHRRVYDRKGLEQEMQQNVRHAMRAIQHDLQTAGSGLVMGTRNLDDWFWNEDFTGVTDIPHIIDGVDGAPDELVTAGYAGPAVARLNGEHAAGSIQLKIKTTTGTVWPYEPRVGDVLVVGGVEAVRVVDLANYSDKKITVWTEPLTPGSGLELIHPDGSDLFLLNVIRYRIETLNGVPGLVREDSRLEYQSDADRRIAEHITDLQMVRSSVNTVRISLTGVTPEGVQVNPEGAGEPLTYTLETTFQITNPTPQLLILAWPEDILIQGGSI